MSSFYIYAADVWCESCGEDIKRRIEAEGKAPSTPEDEASYDSDDYPKGPYDNEEADTPQHCGSHDDCLEATELPDGSKAGKFLANPLTSHGYDYVLEAFKEGRSGITRLWMDNYRRDHPLCDNAFVRGYYGFYDGDELDDNPFHPNQQNHEWDEWFDGWEAAKEDER